MHGSQSHTGPGRGYGRALAVFDAYIMRRTQALCKTRRRVTHG
jgi:hypothetical protein